MFMPTVGFLRFMSLDSKCPRCRCHYWGAMETESAGICGRCLSAAFPTPMREAPENQELVVRKSRPSSGFSLSWQEIVVENSQTQQGDLA
jgi:hypothetical protein